MFLKCRERRKDGKVHRSWSVVESRRYIEAHVRELLSRYDVDGLFFDILFHDRMAHHSDAALALRRRHGLTAEDLGTFQRFENVAQDKFCSRFTSLAKAKARRVTIFYNSVFDPITVCRMARVVGFMRTGSPGPGLSQVRRSAEIAGRGLPRIR